MQTHTAPSGYYFHSLSGLPVHSVLGVDVRILADGSQTGGAYANYHARCTRGAGAPPHRHDGSDESFFVIEGEFEILCGTERLLAKAGDYIFIPRGMVHGFTGVSECPAALLGTGTPAGHEAFFREAAALAASGDMQPEKVAALCQRHGIELMIS